MKDITLSLMVARTDVVWIKPMLEHLCKAHRPFVSKIVVFADTAPLGPGYRDRPGVGTMEQLYQVLEDTKKEGIIDEIKDISYDSRIRKDIYRRHFGYDIGVTHDFRGYPILGSIYAIENAGSDLVLHFDADVLFHQKAGTNWLAEATDLLDSREDVMFVAPHPGPPTKDCKLNQRRVRYRKEENYFSFKQFSSRIFLMSLNKFEQIIPMEPQYISMKRRIWQNITGKSACWNWEIFVSEKLKKTKFIRADLCNHDYWTLHTPDHGPEFVKNLPQIIQKVESGWFPESQAGDYDMILKDWVRQE
jgi:hypothetical protein